MSYSETALDLLEKGQLEDFKKQYALALRHDDDDTLYGLAEELYSLGFVNQSKRIYEKLLEKYPDEDELRTHLADILIGEDKTDEALLLLNEIKPDSDAYVQSLMVAADLYQTQELFEVSEQKLIRALELAPEETVIRFALAELYFTMREFAKAIPLYLGIIKDGFLNYSAVNIVERIGVAYANEGKFEQAVGYLEQVHSGEMTPDVKFELGFTYLQLGETKKAITTLSELQDTDPQYTSLYPYLGHAYEEENQNEDALKVLQEGLAVDEFNEKLWLQSAKIALKLNDEELAETYLNHGRELDPEDLEIAIQLSNLLIKQERWQDNIDLVSKYLDQDNLDPQLYWNLAVSYDALENLDQAQKAYESAQPFFMDQPDFLKPAVYFFRKVGQLELAERLLARYLELVPEDDEMVLLQDDFHQLGY
ncbi:TPR repeat-containing protein [Secundilactobacillus oryzae JCM 18671]|uniref:TPR repeat-containing protein n=1 Tax=Secundilactobacillus oryzae JCM 18671 TaxID=1291743 RepID=A0A081BH95_9LACO|nr:tetratricopeptide repeat protein [Secundilactobacillus oryzae]GAK47413.1 TPR repeat-containing protein [Secundilactobacillus oryzae JCM 18671]